MNQRENRLRLMKQGEALHNPLADNPATELALIEMGLRAESGTLTREEVARIEKRVAELRSQIEVQEAAKTVKQTADLVTNADRFGMWMREQGYEAQPDPLLEALAETAHANRDPRFDVLDEASAAGGDVMSELFDRALTDEERAMKQEAAAEEKARQKAYDAEYKELKRWMRLTPAEQAAEARAAMKKKHDEDFRAKRAASARRGSGNPGDDAA
jgi:hypothetical protein